MMQEGAPAQVELIGAYRMLSPISTAPCDPDPNTYMDGT